MDQEGISTTALSIQLLYGRFTMMVSMKSRQSQNYTKPTICPFSPASLFSLGISPQSLGFLGAAQADPDLGVASGAGGEIHAALGPGGGAFDYR